MVGAGMAVNAEEILAGSSFTMQTWSCHRTHREVRDGLISSNLGLFRTSLAENVLSANGCQEGGSAFKYIYFLKPFSVALSSAKDQPLPG